MEDSPHDPPIPDPWTAVARPWTVYIDDNFHYMDEDSRLTHGRYATFEEAVAVCMKITRTSVAEHAGTEGGYSMFGDDPWVAPRPSAEEVAALLARHPDWPAEAFERGFFSARDYASILQRKA